MAEGDAVTVLAGRIVKPHGLDGSVHVVEADIRLFAPGREMLVDGAPMAIERLAGTDRRPIVRFAGCDSREAAELLRGLEIRVPKSEAPALGEDEWWVSDLVGCEVVDGSAEVGRVDGVIGLPSCEALQVTRASGGELLVPIVGDAVREVDIGRRRIDVDLRFLGEEPVR